MKEMTTAKDIIKKSDLWMTVILLIFFVSLHRFCTSNAPMSPPQAAAEEITAPFCPGVTCFACFCAAGNASGMQRAMESRYPQ